VRGTDLFVLLIQENIYSQESETEDILLDEGNKEYAVLDEGNKKKIA
jgi:hypothetical protein